MSDPQTMYDALAEDNELTRLEKTYRAARFDQSGDWREREARIEAAKQEIRASRGDSADAFIDSLDREIEYEGETDRLRRGLQDALDAAEAAVQKVATVIGELGSDQVYDVEIAEGDLDGMNAALTGARLHLAALRHFTRHAKPETQP